VGQPGVGESECKSRGSNSAFVAIQMKDDKKDKNPYNYLLKKILRVNCQFPVCLDNLIFNLMSVGYSCSETAQLYFVSEQHCLALNIFLI
jgi:hypothetical protein